MIDAMALDKVFHTWHLTSASIGKRLESKHTNTAAETEKFETAQGVRGGKQLVVFRRSRTWKETNFSVSARMWITESSQAAWLRDSNKCVLSDIRRGWSKPNRHQHCQTYYSRA